jgi:hypothetical protein
MADRQPIQFKPGVFRQGSEAEMQGQWYESHLVRWVEGVMRPVNGWEKIVTKPDPSPFASPIRAMHVWVTRDGIQRTAVLCEGHLYLVSQAGEVTDISPTPPITAPGSTTVGGYGYYVYDYGLYDTPRPDRPDTIQAGPCWSLSNFGDDLVAMASSDHRLLRWKYATPTVAAEQVPNAPLGRCFVVTPERHIMIFQNGSDFNWFGWCGQEDLEDWDYSDLTSSASFYEIEPAAPFLAAKSTRFGVLAFTVVGAYFIRYLGTPYFYTYEFLGHYNVPVTSAAMVEMADTIGWYSTDGFWTFDGNTVAPLPCPLLDWIQRTIDPLWQFRRTAGLYLGMQSEAWMFFPSKGKTENDNYVCWNFQEKWWAMGRLSRTCGVTGSALTYPLMSDGSQIFMHEKGLFYYDAPELPYAQSASIQIADGNRLVTASRGLVDTRAPASDVVFYVTGKRSRISDPEPALVDFSGLLPVKREGGKLAFRVTGRDLIIRIQSQRSGVEPWTFGKFLCQLKPRGRR